MEFRILGPLEVDGAAGPIELSGGKQRALLAILLLHANEVVDPARLIEALWSDGAPADASKTLQIHVSRLRRALAPEDVVQTRPGGYIVDADAASLDLPRFEQLVDRGRSRLAASNAAAAREALVEALALWRGPPLAESPRSRSPARRSRGSTSSTRACSRRASKPTSLSERMPLSCRSSRNSSGGIPCASGCASS